MGLPLTFNQQTFKLRYSSVQRFVRLYLPANFAQHTADCALVAYILNSLPISSSFFSVRRRATLRGSLTNPRFTQLWSFTIQ